METLRTIDWEDGSVVLIDQRKLPDRYERVVLSTVGQLVEAIKTLTVRGAMALGVAGAMGVALGVARAAESGEDYEAAARQAAVELVGSRPTAVNLAWGVERALAAVPRGPAAVTEEALKVRDEDIETNRAMGELGADLLGDARRLLTHCNAGALAGVEWGSALSVVRVLQERHGVEDVLVSETRPLLQGSRLTAWELGRMGIPFHVIVDGAGAGLLLQGAAEAVVVGADRIAANGDVVNKVGTLAHALAAKRAGVPFVVAAPESTIDLSTATGHEVPVEERDAQEVLTFAGEPVAPLHSLARNPAFDVTPADLVTAIVTEKRVIRVSEGQRPDEGRVQ
ncbi:MAG: S-methyl-5-thioribose-1-phosphate isomerase [Actinomycetota bacterium]|nr:S-methyl-5-thioribose-1-phosphate isomerase [Actinomycetota bacterium]